MSQPQPARLAFDEVIIDVAGQRVWRDGIEQSLEPKAFAVLALLAGAPGRVFGRDEILDAVWGHRHVTPGVLNRVMTLLRHALGEDALNPRFLHTVHGIGYRFDAPSGTSAGIDPAADAVAPQAAARQAGRAEAARHAWFRPLSLWVASSIVALVLAGWMFWPRSPAAQATRSVPMAERSIAVLPLVNASADPGQQYFSDGLSETLIASLSRFDGLKVIGRTSAFRFRDGKDDSRTVGRKLGVSYLLGGSVQRAGDTVRINATLTRAEDGSALWAEHYDRPYRDLFALQDEIARAVADALQAKLLPTDASARQNDRPPSGNIEAYSAYLQGMQYFYQPDMRKSAEYQARATRLDPGYAMAWAQLSIAWTLIGQAENDRAKAQEAFGKSRAASDKALQLAPDLGLGHAARGNLLLGADFDWQAALAEFRRGTQLAPEHGPIHGGFSRALAANGKLHEALEQRHRFLSIEPLFAFNYFAYAGLLAAEGRLDEAEKNISIGEKLQPRPGPHPQRLQLALLRNDAKAALEIARQQAPEWRGYDLALAKQIGPDRAAADSALAEVLADARLTGDSPYPLAQIHALRGDADQTVAWLERTWAKRDVDLHHLLYDPLILRFRDDPRLIAFCAKIGLPPPSQSEALSIDQIRAANATAR